MSCPKILLLFMSLEADPRLRLDTRASPTPLTCVVDHSRIYSNMSALIILSRSILTATFSRPFCYRTVSGAVHYGRLVYQVWYLHYLRLIGSKGWFLKRKHHFRRSFAI